MEHRTSSWRGLAAAIAAVGLLASTAPQARADDWPKAQPIRLVVPWAPGGAADFLGRLLAQSLSTKLGQTVVVENRPGGATNIGSLDVAKAAPDGYTLLMASSNNAANMALFKTLPYDFGRDFAPVALVGYTPMVLVTNPSVPAANLHDFIAYAKMRHGKLTYASAGVGSPAHLAMEKFERAADVRMSHVPYKGAAPAVNDLLGDHVQTLITNATTVLGQVKAGRLRALAITGRSRLAVLPAVPTFAEAGLPDYETTAWYGVVAPKKTPAAIVERLAATIRAVLNDPAVAKHIEQQGVVAARGGTPATFAKLIDDDVAGYRELVAKTGIAVE
jgi:tripartite-type tricarboxylate transporter receptor subunit TctC